MTLEKSTVKFLKELAKFDYALSVTDHVWQILYKNQAKKWNYPKNPQEGFTVELRGESLGRMAETLKMLSALHNASLPVTIASPEEVRKKLLGQDNIRIIPKHCSLHRANQHFTSEEDVFDVMHYDDLGRYKRRITPFIRWEALPILKLRDV